MELHGKNIIAGEEVESTGPRYSGFAPASGTTLTPTFEEAGSFHINQALEAAEVAFREYRKLSAGERATFLEKIAEEIMALGDQLIERAHLETALAKERLTGERARTVNQLRMFADLIREGSWVDARIDRAIPDRLPLPKSDLRRMLIPIGPVAIFGASNFPLAFSVAGGDTASALAAGCPIIVKAHPAHPGTSELTGRAIVQAIDVTEMPRGIFSLIHSNSHQVGLGLVKHPLTRAVGFTGSLRGGRALFDAAAQRPDPIPVFAEMGSMNPVIILPGAMQTRATTIAEGLKQSVTLGAGQFCTNPGLAVVLRGEVVNSFVKVLGELIAGDPPATMLYPGILQAYENGINKISEISGVSMIQSTHTPDVEKSQVRSVMFVTDTHTFLQNHELSEEVFGPSTVIVTCD